jgi:hypothetical protein
MTTRLGYWDEFKAHVNNQKVGSILRRVDLLNFFGWKGCNEERFDNFRLLLTNAGYLKHVGRGEYKLVEKVRPEMTMRQVAMLNAKKYGGTNG